MIRKKTCSMLLNRDFLFPVLILALSTVTFLILDLDLLIQRIFYNPADGWFLKDAQPWRAIYLFGNFPALILAVGGLILLALGLQKTSLARYRKICLYLILVMALGPGLIINTILKENWGRPRPRNIMEFGGKYKYERILQIDPGSPGKSFPCGHASMGFYFFVLCFIFRKRKPKLARGFLALALLWGSLIGLTRILQGGHYASDVIWTGGIMYLSAAGLFYLLKMDRDIYFQPTGTPSRRWKLIRFSAGLAIIFLILLVLLATPNSQQRTFSPPAGWEDSTSYFQGDFRLDSADLEIRFGGGMEFRLQTEGFGFPQSKLNSQWQAGIRADTLQIDLTQSRSGFFMELNQFASLLLPENLPSRIEISQKQGNLFLYCGSRLEFELITRNEVEIDTLLAGIIRKTDKGYEAGMKPAVRLQVELGEGRIILY